MDFKQKYLKYKNKYLQLKKLSQTGGNNCSHCGKPDARYTCQCKTKFYCSKECQVKVWSSHKEAHNAIMTAAIIHEQAALVPAPRPPPFLGKQENKLLFEVALRKRAVDAVTDLYARLNSKFRYSSTESNSWEHKYPLWHRDPISPDKANLFASLVVGEPAVKVVAKEHYDRYHRLKSICLPLFNTDLTECLAFESVPDHQAERAPIMECTAAFHMAKVALLHRFNPSLAKRIFNISFLDRMCDADTSEKLTGYDRRLEVKFLKDCTLERATKSLTLAQVTSLSIKDILLDEKKAQRLEMAFKCLNKFFVRTETVKLGDGCYVRGHPSYKSQFGPYSGEHVYCVGPDQFIGLQGLDYGDFRDYTGIGTPKTLNQIRRSLAIEYIRVVLELAEGRKPRPDQIPEEMIQHFLAEIPTAPHVYGALNVEEFYKYTDEVDLSDLVEVAAETAAQQSTLTDAELLALIDSEPEAPIRALMDKKGEEKKGGGNDNLYFDKSKFLLEYYQIL